MMLKLYPILFEKSREYIFYTAPEYALFVKSENSLVLFHVPSLMKYLKDENSAQFDDVCAATIQVADLSDKCLGAKQVSIVAGSSKYPGAGFTLYGLASDYYQAPLTSDRNHSSSVAARETWAKIETSPDWKIAGDGLDNYASAGDKKHSVLEHWHSDIGKVYMDITGTYPNRSAKPRFKKGTSAVGNFFKNLVSTPGTEPRTLDTSDDCPLPNKLGNISSRSKMADIVGTANAYEYVGPNKASPLIQRAQEIITEADSDLILNPKLLNIEDALYKMSVQLFTNRYHGSDTPR